MTENLKMIVQEVNALLGTDYNLISFDSLSSGLLLQCLVDVLAHFDACEKVNPCVFTLVCSFNNQNLSR